MALTDKQQQKLRNVAQVVAEILHGGFFFVRIMVGSIAAVAVALFVGGLLTADPDTTTFRDFLMAVQSAPIHRMVIVSGCVVGLIVWFFTLLNRSNRAHYPMAAATMGTAKAAPKKEGGE